LTLKISDPIMPLKPDLHLVLTCLGKKLNEIIVCSCDLTNLSFAIHSDTHWMLVFRTILCQFEKVLIISVISRQSAFLTRLEQDCATSSVFFNAFNNEQPQ